MTRLDSGWASVILGAIIAAAGGIWFIVKAISARRRKDAALVAAVSAELQSDDRCPILVVMNHGPVRATAFRMFVDGKPIEQTIFKAHLRTPLPTELEPGVPLYIRGVRWNGMPSAYDVRIE